MLVKINQKYLSDKLISHLF